MPKICLYFQLHQPWRLKSLSVMDMGKATDYFGDRTAFYSDNGSIIRKVAEKSYRPMLELLQDLSARDLDFRYSLSVTGVAIEQMKKYCPDIAAQLIRLAGNGNVEFLAETYYHSLASLYSPAEFLDQVTLHRNMVTDLFGQVPKVFRNTELIYTNKIARMVADMGFTGMLAEGADKILAGRKPTRLYRSPDGLPLLLKHYLLSDDIAFRFGRNARNGRPLTAETFCHWINSSYSEKETVNLFMDFETFGEHQWRDTGIFDFFSRFVTEFVNSGGRFVTVSKAIAEDRPQELYDSAAPVSWADTDRDISAWSGNSMQLDCLRKIYGLENRILQTKENSLIADWRKLQTSDHFYYMCTKWADDGDVHAYFSPYQDPYLAYANYSQVIADLNLRVNNQIYG